MNLALFDFDGTITHTDTFRPFIELAVGRRRRVLGGLMLAPVVAAYGLGYVPATRMRALAAFCGFRGRREDELDALGARYASTFESLVRTEALERIRWHRAAGDRVVVVSASLRPYLRAWCDTLGLELICTELESRGGVLTGRYLGGDCTGAEKARRVRVRYDLERYPVIYAYGDTHEDHELLRLASKRYFRWREVGEL
jgi:HAD superfamily hydrolase (TIGR01490 family)